MKVYSVTLFLLLCIASPITLSFSIETDSIDKALSKYSNDDSPGFAVAVTHKGKLVYAHYKGLANLEHSVPIDGQTLFNIASISKSFTGYAIAKLENEGKVDAELSIRRYIPELSKHYESIKVKHLLHHTSGLWDSNSFLTIAGFNFNSRVPDSVVVINILNSENAVNFDAGTMEQYSNTNYVLLSEIVSRVSQEGFSEYLKGNIFSSMRMDSPRIESPEALNPNIAASYERNGESIYPSSHVYSSQGSSSILMSMDDFTKWMMSYDSDQSEIVKPHALAKLGGKLNTGTSVDYGYGLNLSLNGEMPYVGHSGRWNSYNSNYRYYTDENVGVAIFCNFACSVNGIRKVIEGSIFGESRKVSTLDREEPLPFKAENISQFEGDFKLQPGWIVSIHAGNDDISGREFIYGENPIDVFATNNGALYLPKYKASLKYGGSGNLVTFTDAFGEINAEVLDSSKYDPKNANNYVGVYYSDSLETSYRVFSLGDELYINHSTNGRDKLTSINSKIFVGAGRFVAELHFEFGDNGKASGIVFHSLRLQGLRFRRMTVQ